MTPLTTTIEIPNTLEDDTATPPRSWSDVCGGPTTVSVTFINKPTWANFDSNTRTITFTPNLAAHAGIDLIFNINRSASVIITTLRTYPNCGWRPWKVPEIVNSSDVKIKDVADLENLGEI
jgi:hypothetical protein